MGHQFVVESLSRATAKLSFILIPTLDTQGRSEETCLSKILKIWSNTGLVTTYIITICNNVEESHFYSAPFCENDDQHCVHFRNKILSYGEPLTISPDYTDDPVLHLQHYQQYSKNVRAENEGR